ncbi:hypothetical protein ACS0TY_027765 [Phlomoides rotata]
MSHASFAEIQFDIILNIDISIVAKIAFKDLELKLVMVISLAVQSNYLLIITSLSSSAEVLGDSQPVRILLHAPSQHSPKTPQPVPDDCTDSPWKYFKGCLGELDGTYIPVKVLAIDIPHYRNRKGFVSVNVFAVCDQNMNYICIVWMGGFNY